MARNKNGAYRAAIEKQFPSIPVTFPYNWIILPHDGTYCMHRKKMKIIFH